MARTPRQLLIAAAGCAVAFAVLLAAIYLSWDVRVFDATAMDGFIDVQRPWLDGLIEWLAHLGDPEAVGLFGAALAAIAVARGRPRHAAAVVFLLAVTSVSSQLLKGVIDYPRYEAILSVAEVKPAAFPSGHATAAMALALCGVLVAPARLRPLAAVAGAFFALAVSYSILLLGWHFPSDVAGGFLVATGWTLVTVAVLQRAARRWPERTVREGARAALERATDRTAEAGLTVALSAGALAATLAVTAVVLFRLPELLGFATAHTGATVVAVALAASAAALLGGVAAALLRGR
jgi:membrane-associated phospholipid phosphatase